MLNIILMPLWFSSVHHFLQGPPGKDGLPGRPVC